MSQPLVHFVILNWNQPELTAACLDSLSRQEYRNFQIVLVDNGSSDASVAFFRERYPGVILIEQHPNIGYSPGNNLGIAYALSQETDYIFLLNNDTEVHPQMLSMLMDVAESDSRVGAVGPTMYYHDPANVIWAGENHIDWPGARLLRSHFGELDHGDLTKERAPRPVDCIDTCAILIKRRVFEKVGLFNADYFINYDDLDLNLRIARAGFSMLYVPQAKMWHKVSATMGQASPATTYYMTRNALLLFWTQAPSIFKYISVARILGRTLRPTLAWTVRRKYRNAFFRRKRAANLFALRDFFLKRFGRMGPDVERACDGRQPAPS